VRARVQQPALPKKKKKEARANATVVACAMDVDGDDDCVVAPGGAYDRAGMLAKLMEYARGRVDDTDGELVQFNRQMDEQAQSQLRAYAQKFREFEQAEKEEEEEEDVAPNVVAVRMDERGHELFTPERLDEARRFFPLKAALLTVLTQPRARATFTDAVWLQALPIAMPAPPLLLLLGGEVVPYEQSSFDVMRQYSQILYALSTVYADGRLTLSRFQAAKWWLFALHARGELRSAHLEQLWHAYVAHMRDLREKEARVNSGGGGKRKKRAAAAAGDEHEPRLDYAQVERLFDERLQRELPPVLAEDFRVVDDEHQCFGVTDECRRTGVTLAQLYAQLDGGAAEAVPREHVYRALAMLPQVLPPPRAPGDESEQSPAETPAWALRADLAAGDYVFVDDVVADRAARRAHHMLQFNQAVHALSLTPRSADGAEPLFAPDLNPLHRQFTAEMVRADEVAVLQALLVSTRFDAQAMRDTGHWRTREHLLVRADQRLRWLCAAAPPPNTLSECTPAVASAIAEHRRSLTRTRREVIVARASVTQQFRRINAMLPPPDAVEPPAPFVPHALDENEARALIVFVGADFESGAHFQLVSQSVRQIADAVAASDRTVRQIADALVVDARP